MCVCMCVGYMYEEFISKIITFKSHVFVLISCIFLGFFFLPNQNDPISLIEINWNARSQKTKQNKQSYLFMQMNCSYRLYIYIYKHV